jgi:hypothetical protein
VKEVGNQYYTCNIVARQMYNINNCFASKGARFFTYCGEAQSFAGRSAKQGNLRENCYNLVCHDSDFPTEK